MKLLHGFLLTCLILLIGCQSVPLNLRGEFASLSPADFEQLPPSARVRWAGLLHQTRNERLQTCLVIIGMPQKASARPRPQQEPLGRFEACADRFLDPGIYKQGQWITVTGTLERIVQRQVGDYPLQVPVVKLDQLRLWPRETERDVDAILLFDPWWPGHGYPAPVIHHPHHVPHESHPPTPDQPRH